MEDTEIVQPGTNHDRYAAKDHDIPRTGSIKVWQQIAASGSGALITSLFMTPLDVVKIRLQVQAKPMATGDCFIYCNGLMDHVCTCLNGNNGKPWYKAPGYFNGTLDAMVKITRNEGITRLWSGLPPTLLMAVPATALYYTTYDRMKYKLQRTLSKDYVSYAPVIAGGTSRIIAATVISPLELVRTKMQSRPLAYSELVRCVRNAVEVDGALSLWRGLGPTLLRDVPFSVLFWFNYEYFRSKMCAYYGITQPSVSDSFLCGASSGMIASIVTQPFDVVKTQRQIELGEMPIMRKTKLQLSSTKDIIMNIYSKKGINGLNAGMMPRLAKITPACAIMISSYEYGKTFFGISDGSPT